jgi:hypothetical protein
MIDFTEIDDGGEQWEAFARDFLYELGFATESPPDRGADRGKDLLVVELESGLTFEPPAREPVADAAPGARESTAFGLKPEASGAKPEAAHTRRRSARTEFQGSFKYEGAEPRSRTVREVPAIEPNQLENLDLENWLGGRDSSTFAKATADKNPDNVVQSHVSQFIGPRVTHMSDSQHFTPNSAGSYATFDASQRSVTSSASPLRRA